MKRKSIMKTGTILLEGSYISSQKDELRMASCQPHFANRHVVIALKILYSEVVVGSYQQSTRSAPIERSDSCSDRRDSFRRGTDQRSWMSFWSTKGRGYRWNDKRVGKTQMSSKFQQGDPRNGAGTIDMFAPDTNAAWSVSATFPNSYRPEYT
jgi:hypothetical protein